MNILYVIYSPLGVGGAEVSTLALAKAMQNRGHHVFIASTGIYPDIDTFVFRRYRKIPFYSVHNLYLESFLKEVIKDKEIDIIHPQDRLTSIPAIRAARSLRIPSVVHFRDYWFACPKSSCLRRDLTECVSCGVLGVVQCSPPQRILWDAYKMFYLAHVRLILEQADAKIAVSSAVKRKLNALGVQHNVSVIHNSREPIVLPAISKSVGVDVVFFGSFFETKGVLQIIDVMAKVITMRSSVRFTLVGDGPLISQVKKFVANKGLNDNFILPGRVSHNEVWKYYALADIVVLPSLWSEPLSGIPIEAMVAGKPIVASANGGTVDMVEDGVTGYLVGATDKAGWIEKILALIDNKPLRESMANEARRKSLEYTPEIGARRVEEVYRSVLL